MIFNEKYLTGFETKKYNFNEVLKTIQMIGLSEENTIIYVLNPFLEQRF